MERYAVFGHPIRHSQSPRIHALFAAQTGQVLEYGAQDVPAGRFEAAAREFFAAGGKGINCTVPLKELAWRFAAQKSARAERARAVNTLAPQAGGALFGDNTDGAGLLRDLCANLSVEVENRRILVLGAGGATRGILQPLLEAKPAGLFIANRTAEKARLLADEFSMLGPVSGGGFEALAGQRFALVLNATAASLSGDLPPLPDDLLCPEGVCYDLAYGRESTPFVRWGKAHGARLSVDGLGMLVEQAAEAFHLWRGVTPDSQPVIELLNRERAG